MAIQVGGYSKCVEIDVILVILLFGLYIIVPETKLKDCIIHNLFVSYHGLIASF